MGKRGFLAALLLVYPAGVYANAAMGLGLEVFDMRYWLAYVAVTVVFEAWLIGRPLGFGWGLSLLFSASANLISAIMCTNLGAVGLHNTLGPKSDPNPFGSIVQLFLGFAVVSSVIELMVWGTATRAKRKDSGLSDWQVWFRLLWVHLLGVPLGLAILLIPEEPYVGWAYQSQVQNWRGWWNVGRKLTMYIDEHQSIPQASNFDELIEELRFVGFPTNIDRSILDVAYQKPPTRVATSLRVERIAFEWNKALSGKKLTGDEKQPRTEGWVWLYRLSAPGFPSRTTYVNLNTGDLRSAGQLRTGLGLDVAP